MREIRLRYKNIFKGYRRGQAAIEVTLGLLACFMLFLCTIQLFVWINRCIVERDRSYENTRIQAGGYATGLQPEPGKAFQDDDRHTETWTPPEFIPD